MTVDFYKLTLVLIFLSTVDFRLFAGIPGLPSITLTEVLVYVMAFLYLGRGAFEKGFIADDMTEVFSRNRAVIFYFVWGALAAFTGIVAGRSTDTLEMYRSLFPSLLVYFFVMRFIRSAEGVGALCTAFLAGILTNVLLGLAQIVFGGPRPVAVNEAFTQKMDYAGNFITNAPTGLFSHPNGLGLLLMPALVILAVTAVRNRSSALFILMAVTSLVMMMTYAKGVLAWTTVGIMIACLPVKSSAGRTFAGSLAAVGGIIVIVAYSIAAVAEGPSSLVTILTRIYLWGAALDIIFSDIFILLLGNGVAEMAARSWKLAAFEYPNAHNGILNQALFYGVPAMVLYVAIFFNALKSVSSAISASSGGIKTAAVCLSGCLVALFGEYFFEPTNVNVTLQVHAFIAIALSNVIKDVAIIQNNEVTVAA